MAEPARIHVTVVFSPAPRVVREWAMALPAGATVGDALRASGLQAEFPDFVVEPGEVGVWGRKAVTEQVLRERDRVEVYRPLRVDPKVARRERFQRQGARAAGLFARKR
jgi:uncharacterized protein